MTGGGSQLSLQGSHDKFLHHRAYHSFFTSTHTTYENFAIESMEITAQGQVNFGKTAIYKIDGNAELMCGGAVEITLPAITPNAGTDVAWMHAIGIYIMRRVEFKAQAQTLDTHYSEFMDMYRRFYVPESHREGYNDLIGEINMVNRFTDGSVASIGQFDNDAPQVLSAVSKPQTKLLVPLQFWWCTDYRHALPIGILLYTNLKIEIEFRNVEECYIQTNAANLLVAPALVNARLFIDYVFLDDAARNRLARDVHFYVFKQVQSAAGTTGISATQATQNYKLPFILPVLEIMFGIREQRAIAQGVRRYDWFDKWAGNNGVAGSPRNLPKSPISLVELKINSQRRLLSRGYLYHARYQTLKHHTSTPSSRGIFAFSFALYPEDGEASGAVNLSRSDNNYLNLTYDNSDGFGVGGVDANAGNVAINGDLYVFALTYNYIYIEAGFLTMIYNS
jgi:hypothetical protein